MTTLKPIKSIEVDCVRIEMIRRGWTTGNLAQRAGLGARSLATQLATNLPSAPTRLKIEAAFGYAVPLWSSPESLTVRKFARCRFGIDPAIANFKALGRLADRAGLPGWQAHKTMPDLLRAVLKHLEIINKRHHNQQSLGTK